MTDSEIACTFLHDKAWVEAVSSSTIILDGETGWKLYYSLKGIQCCEWYLFFYNKKFKRCLFQCPYLKGGAKNVTLFIIKKISNNIYILDLFFDNSSILDTEQPHKLHKNSLPKELIYVCEAPDTKSFNVMEIFDKRNRYYAILDKYDQQELMINNHGQLALPLKTDWTRNNICKHPNKRIINNIIIDCNRNSCRFIIENNNNNECMICQTELFFVKEMARPYGMVVFNDMISAFLLNY